MNEQHAGAGTQRENETQPPPTSGGVTPDTQHSRHHQSPAGGEQTMDRMLNEALGRAARRLNIDQRTGMVLPSPPPDAEPGGENGTEAAKGPPAASKADAGAAVPRNP